ncbi:methyl-accepting chemotaxis protein [Thermolongibacillus altinsuensis]|uniref:Methyl-accepting chemotaxis protein n=1 Tax=Thermolongibacillus altinsuensis TaxID=575256 RepID=A0A4R1QDX6_9BACL|nr:methyl-accepting chemotaxis protein [Thermolongibacillus altinsuensis]TCL48411.1 methyl-accepting chemotaxis protein [Thermolongibacillus altinsuensis]
MKRISVQLVVFVAAILIVLTTTSGGVAYLDEKRQWIEIGMALMVLISVIGLGMFYFFVRRKMRGLEQLQQAMSRVAAGNLEIEPIRYKTDDEIGQLVSAFTTMVQNLQTLVSHMQETGKKVSDSSVELSALSEETTAASEEMNRAIQEIVNGNTSLASELEGLNNETDSLASALDHLLQQNKQVLDLTQHVSEAVENGQKQVMTLQEANRASVDSSNEISVGVTSLYAKVKEIANIVTTIEQIASQTNLLALNASIEAARAGEHGKGFAVVAEEVRKLAEATNESTAEIQRMIQGIEQQTEATVMTMSQTVSISEQLNQAVQDTEKQFTNISSAVNHIIKAIEASSQQLDTIEQIAKKFIDATSTISAVAEQTSASSEEISASVHEQFKVIQKISQSAAHLTELSEQLNEFIRQFRLNEKQGA